MKGAAMKVGQVASFIDTGAFPEEFQERIQSKLAELRDSAPQVSFTDMKSLLSLAALGASLASTVSATALTYRMQPHEKACFYNAVEVKGAKVAFYFAVQEGGAFDVDYIVTGPNERVYLKGDKERQGDFVFTAADIGEYRFCFNNEMSTFAEKLVDFEISVENEQRKAALPVKEGAEIPDGANKIEDFIFKLSGQVSTMSRNAKYFRTRENRNLSTVRSTERRIFNFSCIVSLMMVTMAGLQVFVVRFFFQGARKGYV